MASENITGMRLTAINLFTCSIIGIVVSIGLLGFKLIGEYVFAVLVLVNLLYGFFITYESRLEHLEAGKNGLIIKLRKQMEIVIAKETEPLPSINLPTDDLPSGLFSSKLKSNGTDNDTKLVIKALGSGSYTFRHIDGITYETGLTPDSVTKALLWLTCNGLGIATQGNEGEVWALTQEGRSLLSSIVATENAS